MEESQDSAPIKKRADSSTSLNSYSTMRTNTTWRYDVFGRKRLGKGNMLFTGPDGIRDHRVKLPAESYRCIGENAMSPEGTSEAAYLWRRPANMPHPRPKSRCAGEIGWSAEVFLPPQSLGEFRQALENRHTHHFQGAWYPGPNEKLMENTDAGLVMNVYNYNPNHINRPPIQPLNRLAPLKDSSR